MRRSHDATTGRSPDLAAAYLDGGARLLQLRAPGVASGVLEGWCDAVVARASRYGAAVIVNDRADIAPRAARPACISARTICRSRPRARSSDRDGLIGLSTHTVEQLGVAQALPVTYVAVGPVHATRSKDTGYGPVGLALVRAAARTAAVPVVAIGGITLERAPEVLAAGASAVAVIGDLLASGAPAARVRAYVDGLAK